MIARTESHRELNRALRRHRALLAKLRESTKAIVRLWDCLPPVYRNQRTREAIAAAIGERDYRKMRGQSTSRARTYDVTESQASSDASPM